MTLLQSLTSPARIQMISQVYQLLYRKLEGHVTLENLGKIFDATKHPQVFMKLKTEEEVFKEYITSWGPIDPFAPISESQFVAFYSDISGCIDRADMFEKILKFPFNILM